MRFKATYRKKHREWSGGGYTYEGFVEGKANRSELGHLSYDFTTYAGAHFGAVPAEDVQILGVLGGDEARMIANKIARLKSVGGYLEQHLAKLNEDLGVEIDLHGGRTEMARNLRLAIIETELELEGLKS